MNESFSPKMTSLQGTNLIMFATTVVMIFHSCIKYAAPEFCSKPAPAHLCRLFLYNRLATQCP